MIYICPGCGKQRDGASAGDYITVDICRDCGRLMHPSEAFDEPS